MNAPKIEALRAAADALRLTSAELVVELGLPREPILAFGAPPLKADDYLLKLALGGPAAYPLAQFLADRMPEPAPKPEPSSQRAPHRKPRKVRAPAMAE